MRRKQAGGGASACSPRTVRGRYLPTA